MSKSKINKDVVSCQHCKNVTVIDKYKNLLEISNQHKSSALFAGVNQARRLLLKCNQLKREMDILFKHAGFWTKLLLKNKLKKMKAIYQFYSEKLESWLDSFVQHFNFKYEFSINNTGRI